MKKLFLLLIVTMLLPVDICAQVINGDLNHSGKLEVSDVTHLINNYLTGTAETISGGGDPFAVDNSCIVGTWYKSKTESVTFNADGTTDYIAGCTYKFRPVQGTVLFYNSDGTPISRLKIEEITSDYLVAGVGTGDGVVVYTSAKPVQPVTSITLSQTTLNLQLDSSPVRLTATVEPTYADNAAVIWSSSDEEVAKVSKLGTVKAFGEGTAIITCTAADGSGVKATCTVTVTAYNNYNNGHEYVDLGLSVKWATMNVGASSPEDYGDYFAWGETTTKTTYNWSNYKYCKGNEYTLTKYCTKSGYGTVDNKTVLDLSDDAARANWGGNWRMPTYAELDELRNNCTLKWTTQNSVKGYKVTSKTNGNSIFLPAAGHRKDSSLYSAGSYGIYWSSSLGTLEPNGAYNLSLGWDMVFDVSDVDWHCYYRSYGQSVRPVCP